MARILLELTNHCNLRCRHCYDERHAASGQIESAIIDTILEEGHNCGIEEIVFTGGEPTIHPDFARIVERSAAAGYRYGFVSNGITFPDIYEVLLRERAMLDGVTFSLDGAKAHTHDQLRGHGSFRSLLRAATICVFRDIPFTLNMVITAKNKHEISEAIDLAATIGSQGIRFAHIISMPGSPRPDLELTLHERRDVEESIVSFASHTPILVCMAPGHGPLNELFTCAPLNIEEYNVDYRGNMTLCCQLSGISGVNGVSDVIANIADHGLVAGCERFSRWVGSYVDNFRSTAILEALGTDDSFSCLNCMKHYGKATAPENAVDLN